MKIPLLPLLLRFEHMFMSTIIFTAIGLFVLGAGRVRVTGQPWLRAGCEIAALGGLVAALAFYTGHVLRHFIDNPF
jgi:hypothetical protein